MKTIKGASIHPVQGLDASSLELFARIVSAGSLSAAAKRSGQTRAAVSRRLAAIETRVGQPLLLRTTRTLALTDTGRRLLAPAMTVLDSAEQARGVLQSVHSGLVGRLRITALPSFGNTVLLGLLARFRELHPGVHFELLFSDRRIDLAKEGVDVAFRITRKPPQNWIARNYLPFRVSAYAAPGRLERLADPSGLAELPLLLLGRVAPDQPMTWQQRDQADVQAVVSGECAVYSEDLLSLVRLAERGVGVVLAPDYCAREAMDKGTLVDLLPDWHLPIVQGDCVQILTLPWRQVSPIARAFMRFVLEQSQD